MSVGRARLRAVLFDLDGTLIDWSQSRDEEARARHIRDVMAGLLDALAARGLRTPPPEAVAEEYRRRIVQGWERARDDLRPPHLGDVLVEALRAAGMDVAALERDALLEAFPWSAVPGVTCFPDAPPALQTLLAHGVKIGLVTNSSHPMWLRDRELKGFGLLHLIPHCRLSAADLGRMKPHPQIFQAALDCLGAEAHEAVFVGDNPAADIVGAQKAGMRAVLRSGRHEREAPPGLVEPDYRLDTLAELPPQLDNWFPGWR